MLSLQVKHEQMITDEDMVKMCYAFLTMDYGVDKKICVYSKNPEGNKIFDNTATYQEVLDAYKLNRKAIKCKGYVDDDQKSKIALVLDDDKYLEMFTDHIMTQLNFKQALYEEFTK